MISASFLTFIFLLTICVFIIIPQQISALGISAFLSQEIEVLVQKGYPFN